MYVPCGGTRHSVGTVEMLLECVNILLSLRKQNLKPFPQPHILLQYYHLSSFQQNSSRVNYTLCLDFLSFAVFLGTIPGRFSPLHPTEISLFRSQWLPCCWQPALTWFPWCLWFSLILLTAFSLLPFCQFFSSSKPLNVAWVLGGSDLSLCLHLQSFPRWPYPALWC